MPVSRYTLEANMAAAFAVHQLIVLLCKKLNNGLICKGKYRVNTFTRFLRLIQSLGRRDCFFLGNHRSKFKHQRSICRVEMYAFIRFHLDYNVLLFFYLLFLMVLDLPGRWIHQRFVLTTLLKCGLSEWRQIMEIVRRN